MKLKDKFKALPWPIQVGLILIAAMVLIGLAGASSG